MNLLVDPVALLTFSDKVSIIGKQHEAYFQVNLGSVSCAAMTWEQVLEHIAVYPNRSGKVEHITYTGNGYAPPTIKTVLVATF